MKRPNYLLSALLSFLFLCSSITALATIPVANDDTFQAIEGIPILLDVIANDYDADGDPLVVSLVDPGGTHCWGEDLSQLIINNGDGSLVLKTPTGISGSCTFKYQIGPPNNEVEATVTVHVTKLSTVLPTISSQPVAFDVSLDGTGTFSVTATGPGTLSYQWQKNGQDLEDVELLVNGANSETLTIAKTASADLAQYQCIVSNEYGEVMSDPANLVLITDQASQGPFSGSLHPVPSIIPAEHYDLGGEGFCYHDTTAGNSGRSYRTGDVDFAVASDYSFYATDLAETEWLEFTFLIPADGNYDLSAIVAADTSNDIRFHWETADGTLLSCGQALTASGGPEDWVEIQTPGITLTGGVQVLRFVVDSDGWNLDAIAIDASPSTMEQAPFAGSPPDVLTGIIEIENYDRGGLNVAYFDTSEGNASDFCGRAPDWVDLDERPSGQKTAVEIETGEWLEYTLLIPSRPLFDLVVRYKADSATQLEMRIPGSPDTVINLPLPARADFGPMTFTDLTIPEGTHIVRLTFSDASGKNLEVNNFEFKESTVYPIRVTDMANSPINDGETLSVNSTPVDTPLDLTFRLHNDHPSVPLNVTANDISGHQSWQMVQALPSQIPPSSSAEFKIRLSSPIAIPTAISTVSLQTSGATSDSLSFTVESSVFLPLTVVGVQWALPPIPGNELDLHEVTAGGNPIDMPIAGDVTHLFLNIQNKGTDRLIGEVTLSNPSEFSISDPNVDLPPSGSPDPIANPRNHLFQIHYTGSLQANAHKSTEVTFSGNFPESPFSFDVVKIVLQGDPVEILQQPTSITLAEGSTGQLHVVAGGGSNSGLNYQWFIHSTIDSQAIDPNDLSDRYSGSDSATLTIQDATTAEAKTYYCLVSENEFADNQIESHLASVSVFDPIQTTSEAPVSKHANPGDTAQFQVFASGGGANFVYQWEFKGINGVWSPLSDGGNISGANNYQLNIVNVDDTDVGEYRCQVSQSGVPVNAAYSQVAGLSLLRFTSHPADGWGYPGDTFTLNSGATAGGRTLAYTWYDNGEIISSATGANFTTHYGEKPRPVFYEVSDGIHTLTSTLAYLYPIKPGTLAADSFNRGFLTRQPLDANVLLPFGSRIWNATGNLVYHEGMVLNSQTIPTSDTATIPFVPRNNHRMGIEVDFSFGSNPPSGSWFGFGFTTHGSDFQNDGEIWVKLQPAFNGQVSYELFANGTTHAIASGTVDGSNSSWQLEYNPTSQNANLKHGFAPIVNGATANVGLDFEVNQAQFMFHSGGANTNGGGDFQLSLFRLFETEVFIGKPDFIAVDLNQQSFINIDVLANDQGDGLALGTNFVTHDLLQHGAVQRTIEDGRWQVRYDIIDTQTEGEDKFKYQITSANPGETLYVPVTILRYKDFALVARPDEITVQADGATEFNPLVNDFHSQNETLTIDAANPFPTPPAHGSVVALDDGQRISYQPDPGYLGVDQFTYQIKDPQGHITQGTIKVFVAKPFDGLFYDDFANTGVGRTIGSPLDNAPGQSGNFTWTELDANPNAPFQFGNNQATHTFNSYASNFLGIRMHESLDDLAQSPLQSDGFESGDFAKWHVVDSQHQLSISSGLPLSGSQSMYVTIDGKIFNNRFLYSELAEGQDQTTVRFKLDTRQLNMSQGNRFKVLGLKGTGGDLVNLLVDQNSEGLSLFFNIFDQNRTKMPSSSILLGHNVHHIEVIWRSDTLGGAILRINGQDEVAVEGVVNHIQRMTRIEIGSLGLDSGTNGSIQLDDFQLLGKDNLLTQTTIAFPPEAGTNGRATLAWVQYPEGLDRLIEGLHVKVDSDGGYTIIQHVIQEQDEVFAQGQIPLGLGQPIRIELWHHAIENSISVWLNGYQVLDRTLLNQRGLIDQWKSVGFVGEGPSNLPQPFRVLNFSLEADAALPDELPDLLVYDSFTGTDGTQIQNRPTDIGQLSWITDSRTIISDNQLTLNGSATKAFGLPFDPDHYQGDQIEVSAAINTHGAEWTALGFTAAAEPAFWSGGQIWATIRRDGKYGLFANGAQLNPSGGNLPIPGFDATGMHHARIRYHKTTGITQLWINGALLHEVDLHDRGFIPNISYAGFHIHAPDPTKPTYIDNFSIRTNDGKFTQAGQQSALFADTFDAPGSAAITNQWPVVGDRAWQASNGMVYRNRSAGISDANDQVGGFPFLPAHFEGNSLLVEADAKVGDGASVGVGFSKAFADFHLEGQLWAEVTYTGLWRLRTHNLQILASGPIANFHLNQWIRMQLWYDRNTNRASLIINGNTVLQDQAMPAGFTPDIRFAGLDLNARQGINATTLQADNFRLALDDTTLTGLSELVPEVVDTYTQSQSVLINGRNTELGNRTWVVIGPLEHFAQQVELDTQGVHARKADAWVPFNANEYSGHLFAIETDFIINSAAYMSVGWMAKTIPNNTNQRHVWAKIFSSGQVTLLGIGNVALYTGQAKIFYPGEKNKVTVVYNRLTNTASLLVNDCVQAKDFPVNGTPTLKFGHNYWGETPQGGPFNNHTDNFIIKIKP